MRSTAELIHRAMPFKLYEGSYYQNLAFYSARYLMYRMHVKPDLQIASAKLSKSRAFTLETPYGTTCTIRRLLRPKILNVAELTAYAHDMVSSSKHQ